MKKLFEQYHYMIEAGEGIEDWEYLLHHMHVNDIPGEEEEVHHCPMLDHLGNKYKVEHIIGEDGKPYHCIMGLEENQEVLRSDDAAKEGGHSVPCANRQI
jgi:hypothetical protein